MHTHLKIFHVSPHWLHYKIGTDAVCYTLDGTQISFKVAWFYSDISQSG